MAEARSHQLEVVGIDQLNERTSELAESIRDLSRSQTEQWQQLPYLALQSEGQSGYNSFNQKLYIHGLLHIVGGAEGLFGTFIDCANGNIVRQTGTLELDRQASDAEVMEAWLPQGENFNATRWLEQYRRSAVETHKSYAGKSELEVRQWRHETAQRLGLLSVFTRAQLASSTS